MSLIYNGTTIKKVIYNGTELTKLIYNGTTVWTSGQALTSPSSTSVTNYGATDTGEIELHAYAYNTNAIKVMCYLMVFDSSEVTLATKQFSIEASSAANFVFTVSSSFDGNGTYEMYFEPYEGTAYNQSESVFGTIS